MPRRRYPEADRHLDRRVEKETAVMRKKELAVHKKKASRKSKMPQAVPAHFRNHTRCGTTDSTATGSACHSMLAFVQVKLLLKVFLSVLGFGQCRHRNLELFAA